MHLHLAKNVLYQLFSRIVTSAAGFLILILIARYLGAGQFGDYTKIISVVSLFYLICDFGINPIYLQKDPETKHFKDLFWLRFFISGGLIVFVMLLSRMLPFNELSGIGFSQSIRTGIIFYSFTIFLFAANLSAQAIFQKTLTYKKLFVSNVVGSFVTLFFVALFIGQLLTLPYLLLAMFLGSGVSAVCSIFLSKQAVFPVTLNKSFTKNLFVASIPVGFMLIFNLIYFRVDTILLSIFKSSKDVGVYGLSYRFFDFLIAIPLFFSNALYPSFLQSSKNFRMVIRNVKIYSIVFTFISMLLVFVFWYGALLLPFIKKDFTDSILPLRLLLLSLPLFFFTSLFQWFLIAHKKQHFLMWIYGISALLNIVLNVLFIPRYSYNASAVITGFCEGLVLIALLFMFFKTKKAYD